jgi:hypothetical protein
MVPSRTGRFLMKAIPEKTVSRVTGGRARAVRWRRIAAAQAPARPNRTPAVQYAVAGPSA